MKKSSSRSARTLRAVSVLIALSTAASSGLAVAANNLKDIKLSEPRGIDVFVRLQTPSVAEVNAEALRSKGSFREAATQRKHAARITQEQTDFDVRLRGMGLDPKHAQRVGANGLRVRASAAQIAQLRGLPEVRSVGKIERHKAENIDSVPSIGAPQAWARGFTGSHHWHHRYRHRLHACQLRRLR
jgi:hypothetical protein